MKKILVTGGAGRIGRYLLPEFVKKYDVKVFDLEKPEEDVEFYKGDLKNCEDMIEASRDVDAIVHLGAVSIYREGIDQPIFDANVIGTFNVIEAAKTNGIKIIVNSSSVCAWGVINWKKRFTPKYFPIDEKIPHKPDDSYGVAKVFGENLLYAAYKRYGIKSISFRLATVAFPYEDYWINAWKEIDNPEYEFKEFPMSMIDFMWQYVDPRDLPQAYCLALNELENGKISNEIYNLGADDVFSTLSSIDLIMKYYPDTEYIDNSNGFLQRSNSPLWDISKIKKDLGFKPQFTWREYKIEE